MLRSVDLGELERLRGDLGDFVAEVFASLARKDQRRQGDCYLRGLMLDGRRKSIQPMADRLPDGNMQALQQFVSQSPWDHTPVLRQIAGKMTAALAPEAWVIDDTSFPKAGDQSVATSRQYCGALGKRSLCQVGVSVHAVTDKASSPLSWRLFVPPEWDDRDDARRRRTGLPAEVGHVEKWRLAIDTLEELITWGLAPQVVVADAGYGQSAAFRHALRSRDLDHIVAVRGDETAHRHDAEPVAPAYSGAGRRTLPRYRTESDSLRELATREGRRAFRQVTWRQGSRGAMRSRFRVLQVRPAGKIPRTLAAADAGGSAAWDGVLPAETLLVEWPPGEAAPTDYWLTNLPPDTAIRRLVRLAKIRWRIEHDYREMKHGLGLDHFEGRTWRGWHHHVTLVTAAHAFLTLRRLDPKAETPA
ncbi:IS701 family transposase [Kitasatospora sp. NBC_00240]|uniref:IS701 family transposase n=1 Tax=Kitasatospora sp. NBC_00240 TaxID=2903567 RepID=UPI002250936C|nr:IS701 family transposase [Kitasatospora sp. NBC_00240]MCX5214884.1 IS701 family transposase [Kitasatospora sp. NBC_00240]MCX5214887.1 IS701 family transposase [Kitasatospora sp. NBC_00240]